MLKSDNMLCLCILQDWLSSFPNFEIVMCYSAAYNVAFACKITSELDVSAMKTAFELIVERHSGLRTTFKQGRMGPVQVCCALFGCR